MFRPEPAVSAFSILPPAGPATPGTQSDAPWYKPVEPEEPAAPHRARSRGALIALAAAALAAAGVFSGVYLPKEGRVLVTVSGPLDAPVRDAVVLVDGKRACAPAPCRVTLDRGAYVLRVTAPAYRPTAEKSLSLSAGAEEALHFTLAPDQSAGIELRGEVAGA
jgi:hypothetical protein